VTTDMNSVLSAIGLAIENQKHAPDDTPPRR
jgi:hypothetical protein